MKQFYGLAKSKINDLSRWIVVILLIAASLTPMINVKKASSAQLTSRKATLSTSKPSSTDVQFVFSYNIPTTGTAKQGIIYQFCTTPLGTCTASGWTLTGFSDDSQTGWPTNSTNFTAHAASTENDCTMGTDGATMICFERPDATTGGGAVTHTISGINFNSTIQTIYVRISTYSDNDFQTVDLEDQGVVAVAVVRQLTVNGRVQENLEFCVAAIDGDIDTNGETPANCSALGTATTLDIGVIESSASTISPTTVINGGNYTNGGVLTRTNASGGATVSYWSQQETSSGKFKVVGASCSGTSSTDQCFNSAGASQIDFTTSGEKFGFTASAVLANGDTTNLTRGGEYDGDGSEAVGFAWVDSGAVTTIATSSSVLDYEMLLLRFAAKAATTTPTGSYTVTTGFIATPTF